MGNFEVWTQRFGSNAKVKVLLLHGGPAMTHEYMECFELPFLKEGYEFYQYDQLGSYYSDQPVDSSLWTTERFVQEVEQVRKTIGADSSNFIVLGNSWEASLQWNMRLSIKNLKALIVANMMASAPEYGKYANDVLGPQMDAAVLKEIRALEAAKDFANPRYMELLIPNYYKQHICRARKVARWPEPSYKHKSMVLFIPMQGPSEFGISGRLAGIGTFAPSGCLKSRYPPLYGWSPNTIPWIKGNGRVRW